MSRISSVLRRMITTEKTAKLKEGENKYVFEVVSGASVGRIIQDVRARYKVDVVDAKTAVMPGKKIRLFRTQRFIRLPKWKKAVVTLKEGQKIEEPKIGKAANKDNREAEK